jgi:ubiquinone/menaquinone biosynthesis C-methylase UbiE
MHGETQITAIDAVPGMLELAENQFVELVTMMDPDHPPITDTNRPIFKMGNAVELPFEDNQFDAVFYSIMLHWTSDPALAISEMVRVVRPGGLIFGAQSYKPYINPYLDLVIRSSRNSYGAFWKEDYYAWFKDCGQQLELVTPAGIARVRVQKNGRSQKRPGKGIDA